MQSIRSMTAVILALAGPGECQTPGDGVAATNSATSVRYVVDLAAHRPGVAAGLPRLPSLPRLPRLPRLPSLPRVPKPKWP